MLWLPVGHWMSVWSILSCHFVFPFACWKGGRGIIWGWWSWIMNSWDIWLLRCSVPILLRLSALFGVKTISSGHKKCRSYGQWTTRFNLYSSLCWFDTSLSIAFFLECNKSINFLLTATIPIVDLEFNIEYRSPLGEIFRQSFVTQL